MQSKFGSCRQLLLLLLLLLAIVPTTATAMQGMKRGVKYISLASWLCPSQTCKWKMSQKYANIQGESFTAGQDVLQQKMFNFNSLVEYKKYLNPDAQVMLGAVENDIPDQKDNVFMAEDAFEESARMKPDFWKEVMSKIGCVTVKRGEEWLTTTGLVFYRQDDKPFGPCSTPSGGSGKSLGGGSGKEPPEDDEQRKEALYAACGVPTYTKDGKFTLGATVCEALYRVMKKMPDCAKEFQAGRIGDHYKSEAVQKMFLEESTDKSRTAFAEHETKEFWRQKNGSVVGAIFPSCGREWWLETVFKDMVNQGESYRPPTKQ